MNREQKLELLFVYGTLKEPVVQQDVIGRLIAGIPAILEGYKMSNISINGTFYPNLIPMTEGLIEGLLLTVTLEELELIDQYETEAYQRLKLLLKNGQEAWVYIANQGTH